MNTLEAIRTRRSTRKLRSEMITEEELQTVIEAGRCAPCGGNSQTTHFIVITDPEVLQRLAVIAEEEFAKMEVTENTYRSLKNSINASKKGNYVFYYNAPLLILTANKIGYGNAMADCACALENMMIAANELDLGSCWINQVHWLSDHAKMREYLYTLGMQEDEQICGGLIVGYPDTEDGKPIRSERNTTGNPVTYVRGEK